MSEMEQIEIDRYRTEIEDDVQHLLKKYCRIMSWNIPELDQDAARSLITQALKDSLEKLDGC